MGKKGLWSPENTMNYAIVITRINEAVKTLLSDGYKDSDVDLLIDLSPGHYLDAVLQNGALESPHRTMTALHRCLKMIDDRNPVIDHFLHRLANDRYDAIIFPLLKTPGQENLVQSFLDRAIHIDAVPKLIAKVIQMTNRFKATQRLHAADIDTICSTIEQRPNAKELPYEKRFWDECRRSAQVREILHTLSEDEVKTVDQSHRKRALTSVFMRAFFSELGGHAAPDMKEAKALLSLPVADIQDSFSMAFSLMREYLENSLPHSDHPKEKIRSDIIEISERISHSFGKATGVKLDKPKRVLQALDKLHAKPAAGARPTEKLTHI